MIQPAFHIGDPDQAHALDEGHLLVEVSAQSLNYILFTKDPHQLLLLRQYRLYTTGDRSPRDLIEEVFESDAFLRQHAGRALIVYNFPEGNIIPSEFYTESIKTAVTTLVHGESSNEYVFGEQVSETGMHNVYRVPVDIHSLLKEKFAGSRYWHIYTLMLLSAPPSGPADGNTIRSVFYHDKFIASLYINNTLQLIQTFSYQTPEDVAYYLLLLAKQFGVPPSGLLLSVSGLIDSQSALYSELLKYFPEVLEEGHPEGITSNGLLQEFPQHYFSPLLKMSLCGL